MSVDPADQFQVGDAVLLVHAGVMTTVTGYVWAESIGAPPQIMQYLLSCGIAAPKSALQRWEVRRGTPRGGEAAPGRAQPETDAGIQGAADQAGGPQEPKIG